jgi:hypothetical protein
MIRRLQKVSRIVAGGSHANRTGLGVPCSQQMKGHLTLWHLRPETVWSAL